MNSPMEERLRAHFADRARREVLPGTLDPEPPVAASAVPRAASHWLADPGFDPWQRPALRFAFAAFALLVAIAAALLIRTDEQRDLSTVGPGPGPTDAAAGPAPAPSTTTPTTGADTTTSFSPIPPGAGSPLSVIVAAEGVLGWWDGAAWVRSDIGAPVPVQGGEQYQIVGLDFPYSTTIGSAPNSGCEFAYNGAPGIDVGLPFQAALDPAPVAIHGVPDVAPRAVQLLDPQAGVYQQAAGEALASIGIVDAAPVLSQVVRGDLDGDGTDEVLVAADALGDPYPMQTEPGDYSILFLRRLVDGEVQTSLIAQSVNTSTPEAPSPYLQVYRVGAVADLNGDGSMEVIVNESYWEGSGTWAFELQANGLAEVLYVGCGV